MQSKASIRHALGIPPVGQGSPGHIAGNGGPGCRTLAGIVPVAFAASAQAISLPVDGTFGAGAGCEIVAAHGMAAAVAAGGTEDFPESRATDGEDLVVAPTYAIGPDWVCQPSTVDGEYVALQCVSWGATWIPMPVAHFEVSGDTLLFTMPDEATVKLDRCRP